MQLTNLLAVAAVVLTAGSASAASIYRKPFAPKKVVVFGDSLSDNGNLGRMTGGQFPPAPGYPFNTFTNGPLWVDYLQGSLAAQAKANVSLVVTAYGGSTTADDYMVGGFKNIGVSVPSTLSQVRAYTEANRAADRAINANNNGRDQLYVVWTGANDILNLVQDHDFNSDAIPLSDWRFHQTYTIGRRIDDIIYTLVNDLKARNILIANMAPIDKAPLITQYFPANASYVADLVDEVNDAISDIARKYSVTPIDGCFFPSVRVFDVYNSFVAINTPKNAYNLTYETPVASHCLDFVTGAFNPRCVADPTYKPIFWDLLHPTTVTHKILADDALASINAQFSFYF